MRVAQVNFVRPRDRPEPEALLERWPTLDQVARAVADTGAEVTLVQSFHRDAHWQADGIRYLFVAEPTWPGRASGLAPGRLAHRAAERGDVLHANGLDFPGHIRALCRTGRPVLVQDHASGAARWGRLRRWGLERAAGLAFTDAGQADPLRAQGGIPATLPIYSVPESSTRFRAGDRDAARARSGFRGDPALLWVGRLNANKDPLTILAAVEQAAIALPGLSLWCCYHEHPLLEAVKARIAASPVLRERVRLLGAVSPAEVEALCRAADFFLLASREEGSGYALIEAIACGATPIVSDIAPFRRLTGNGSIGALAPVGDAAAFAAALVRLAAMPRPAQREAVLAHFERSLSFEQVGARLCAIYADLLRRAA
jgi:glycosyltransferase involved in cell wall biosynthesis